MDKADTERTRAELLEELRARRAEVAALKQSEALLRAVIEGIADPVYAKDERGRYLLVNAAAAAVLGRPKAEILGREAEALLPADVVELIRDIDARILAEGVPWAHEGMTLPGSDRIFHVRKVPYRDERGRVIGQVGITRDVTERVQVEAALRARERQLRAIFEGALDAIILTDDAGRYVEANPAACALFGLPGEELIGREVAEFCPSGFDAAGAWAAFRRSGSARGLFRLARPDGTFRETEFAATADVLPGRHLSVLRDMTEQRRAEEAERRLRRERDELLARLQLQFERMPIACMVLDPGARILDWNPAAEQVFGYRRGEAVGRDIFLVVPPDRLDAVRAIRERLLAGDMTASGRGENRTRDGRRIVCDWSNTPLRDADGRVIAVLSMAQDVTERVRAEEALRRSERRFRRVLENSRDVVYQLDLARRTFDYVSPSVDAVLGASAEEFLAGGLPFVFGRVHPEDLGRLAGHPAAPDGSGPGPEIEYRWLVPGRGWRWMSETRTVVRDGGPAAIVGNIRDVTDRRAAACRLRDLSRRLIQTEEAERRRIARELHDEVGQALTAVLLNVRAARRDPAGPGSAWRLEESLGLVERTIGQIRDLSLDLRPSMLDDLGLVDALRSHAAGFARRTGLAATFTAGEEVGRLDPEVETACYRIAQEALTNVARHAGARQVRVELSRPGGGLRLVVADDGAGFDVAAALARAAGGSSLGLLSLRERATLAGGALAIASEPGRGTEVRADFPPAGPGPDRDGPTTEGPPWNRSA